MVSEPVDPCAGVADNLASGSHFGDVTTSEENDLVAHGVVRQAPADDWRRGMVGREVRPAAFDHVVGGRQPPCEINERS